MHRYAAVLALFAASVVLAGAGTSGATAASAAAGARAATARTKPRTRSTHRASTHRASTHRASTHPATTDRARAASAQQLLTAAVAPLVRADNGHVAVAVDDLTSGAQAAYGGAKRFVTASIVKVDILATLLYQLHRTGQPLTPQEQAVAATMIEISDDNSATELYNEVDGAAGISAANRAFGLRQTTVGTGGYWGLTATTVDDQIRLLRQVFTRPSALSPAAQDYIRYLMSHVAADQQWGVPVAAAPGTRFMVKNGWLPNPSLWEINSIGDIERDHQRMLIAVLSDDNAGEYSGISVVEAVARKAAAAAAASGQTSPGLAVTVRRRPSVAYRLMPGEWPFPSG
jgi:hypothetical protein